MRPIVFVNSRDTTFIDGMFAHRKTANSRHWLIHALRTFLIVFDTSMRPLSQQSSCQDYHYFDVFRACIVKAVLTELVIVIVSKGFTRRCRFIDA